MPEQGGIPWKYGLPGVPLPLVSIPVPATKKRKAKQMRTKEMLDGLENLSRELSAIDRLQIITDQRTLLATFADHALLDMTNDLDRGGGYAFSPLTIQINNDQWHCLACANLLADGSVLRALYMLPDAVDLETRATIFGDVMDACVPGSVPARRRVIVEDPKMHLTNN